MAQLRYLFLVHHVGKAQHELSGGGEGQSGLAVEQLGAIVVLQPLNVVARYPNVDIRITDAVTARLEPLVLDGSLDFAVTLNGEDGAGDVGPGDNVGRIEALVNLPAHAVVKDA